MTSLSGIGLIAAIIGLAQIKVGMYRVTHQVVHYIC